MSYKFILLTMFCFFVSELYAQNNQNNQVLSVQSGRFIFGQVSDYRSDQYLLDTQTGRLWQIVETENKQRILQPILFSSIDGTQTIIPEDPEIQMQRVNELRDKNNLKNQPIDNHKE